ncbi:sensor domain-containing protein [Spiribacter halobius]|uniref:Diguanylate cyclase n=1 Tax=Sediminicurvatus halobius TaxID=2182432 RepID=A0A2U2N452_9GAMM|nr:diguanylate cyclase [Spiribacter halobius]PWG63880.1 diguanylate cyclase [Spiribacter halobius]UEX76287.1 diguanylate cyclase [Spiribacter halobius]
MTNDLPIPLEQVLDLLLDAVCAVDAQGRFVFVSAAAEQVFGYPPEEMLGRKMMDFVFEEDRSRTMDAARQVMAGQPLPHFENRYVHKDGRLVHVMWSARWSEEAGLRIGVARDVTEIRHAERMQNALYQISAASHQAEGLDTLYQRLHRILADLLPASHFTVALYEPETQRVTYPYWQDPERPTPPPQPLEAHLVSTQVIRTGEPIWIPDEDGGSTGANGLQLANVDAQAWLGVPLPMADGVMGALVMHSGSRPLRYSRQDLELLQFVSLQLAAAIEHQRAQAWLEHAARHDPLTGLPNRWMLQDRLEVALRWAHRYEEQVAVVYLDLDGFKQINDRWGHEAGDRLLQEVARRLTGCVREADTVSRVGGDEFVLVLNNIDGREAAERMRKKIHAALEAPCAIGEGREAAIRGSIGLALYPEDGEDRETLIRIGDGAMYAEKRRRG